MSTNDTLLSPVSVGGLELSNRVVMAPMTRNQSPENIPTDANVEYYRKRAAGGVGLIVTEGTCVDHIAASGYPGVPYIHGDKSLAGWKRVVDAVHAEGGKIAPQLWHVGGMRKKGVLPEGDVDGYAPSGMNMPGKVNRRVMSASDIDDVIAAFAKGAHDSQSVGFDAVEIHGAHGYLLDQFLWEGTNQRDDAYGGSMENRGKFVAEIVAACRAEVGPDFPIILRWSQWKQQDYTARLAVTESALADFLEPLVDAGVDMFHCSQRRFWEPEFDGSDLNLAGWVKKLTGKPTITVGSVSLDADFIPDPGEVGFKAAKPASLDKLNEMLDRGDFDLVAVGRALIANPDWVRVVEQGNLDRLAAFEKPMLMTLD